MIGVFDSGSGGLTVLRAVRDRLPTSDIVYFGDIANAPYGVRDRSELSTLTIAAITRLQTEGATKIISACNSVSASLVVSLFDALTLNRTDLIEMVEPTVAQMQDTKGRIAIVATPATIASGMYQSAFALVGKEVVSIAIPELAGMIEFGASDDAVKNCIESSLAPHLGSFDTLVLACTHYPFVRDLFAKVCPDVEIIDPAEAVALRAEERFSSENGTGMMHFLISKDSPQFRDRVAALFPNDTYTIEVVE